ncbi:MAG TPA: hypothetical protein VMZ71_09820 [Gemmataceae bacterium]|nr:hypothetical protein [Gemmataceae bacterium]
MSNPTPPADVPASISAAELRRRLLASTPPPLAATSATPEPEDVDPEGPPDTGANAYGSTGQDLLSRLKMPGGSGPMRMPAPRMPDPEPPPRPTVNRRTPTNSRIAGFDSSSAIAGAMNQPTESGHGDNSGRHHGDDSHAADIKRYRTEIRELRKLLDEMKQLLQEASDTEQRFNAREKEYQATIEGKDAQIAELNAHLGSIEDQIARGELAPPPPIPKTRSELEEWADELEKESAKLNKDKNRLADDRRQLREDEAALEKQMREMEVAMARERALIARQETELKRLSAEIQHELDLMQRGDATLREQMSKFQRRAQEVLTTKPTGFGGGGAGSGPHKPPPRR